MKRLYTFLTSLLILFSVISCIRNNDTPETEIGSINSNLYSCPEIGWTIEIPRDWEVLEMDRLEEMDERGKVGLEKSSGVTLNVSGLKHLITFRSEPPCLFTSTIEPFPFDQGLTWNQNQKFLIDLMYGAYTQNGMKCDSASFKYPIDQLEFDIIHFRMYDKKGRIFMTQYIGSRLINGYIFCLSISYDNDEERRIMINAVQNSQFTVRN